MEITFTRGEAGRYSATAVRDDGVRLLIQGSDRKFALPHDIGHYIIEQGLGLQRGFWGRIARGAVYPGITVLSGRQPPHAAERSRLIIKEAEQQGVEAEVLVGLMLKVTHAGLEDNWPAVRAMMREEWRPARPERNPLDAEEVRTVCAELRAMTQRWQALEVGQGITVKWQPARRNKQQNAAIAAPVER